MTTQTNRPGRSTSLAMALTTLLFRLALWSVCIRAVGVGSVCPFSKGAQMLAISTYRIRGAVAVSVWVRLLWGCKNWRSAFAAFLDEALPGRFWVCMSCISKTDGDLVPNHRVSMALCFGFLLITWGSACECYLARTQSALRPSISARSLVALPPCC